jgi:hypothetical protein
MLPSSLLALLSVTTPVAVPFGVPGHASIAEVAAAPSQDAKPVPKADKTEEIKKLVAEFDGLITQRGKQDEEACKRINTLLEKFPECGPKDRESIVAALARSFDQKRVVNEEEGEDPAKVYRLYTTAVAAMSRMGPESVKPLTKLIGDRAHKANLDLLRRAILSLGKLKDPGSVALFLDLVNHKDNVLVGAAAEALGEYGELALEKRKAVFEKLLNLLMALKVEVDQSQASGTPDNNKIERYQTVSGPMLGTLQRLSGHEEREPEKWQKWWNDHKKAKWPVD